MTERFAIGRKQAFQITHSELSLQLLELFDRLIAWPSATPGYPGYRDIELDGPGYCTWSEVGILNLLAKHGNFKRPLEIGCGAGWSTAHLVSGLGTDTILMCIDAFIETASGLGKFNAAAHEKFTYYMDKAGLSGRINLIVDTSPECLGGVAPVGGWDFVFLDGWHFNQQPQKDLEGLIGHMSDDALIVVHDLHYLDVHMGCQWLMGQGWHFVGFPTPNQLAVFWKGNGKNAPKWWNAFLADARKTIGRNEVKLVQSIDNVLTHDPVPAPSGPEIEIITKVRKRIHA